MTTYQNPTQIQIVAALLIDGLEYEDGEVITPSRLAAHLSIDSFDFFNWIRTEGIMERKPAVRGSTPSMPTEESIEMGWMVVESRKKSKSDKWQEKYDQPLFTPAGCEEVAKRVIARTPQSLKRAMRVAKILMMGTTATPPVPKGADEPGTALFAPMFEGFGKAADGV